MLDAVLRRSLASPRRIGALHVATLALTIARASAAFPTSRLVYARSPGAEGCPEQTEVRSAVATRLGYDPFFPSSDKTIVARITAQGSTLKGEVELVDEHGVEVGKRDFTGEAGKCDELVRAMALSISIAIDPKSAETYAQGPTDESASPNEPETPASPEPEAVSPASAPTPSTAPTGPDVPVTPARAESKSVDWSIGGGGFGAGGLAPELTPGAFAFTRARSGAWSLGLEGRAALPAHETVAGVPLRIETYALGLSPCVHLASVFACELTRLELLSASGAASDAPGGTSALLSLGARLGLESAVTRSFGFLASAEMSALPWRVTLRSDSRNIWQTPTLQAGAELAAVYHF